MVATITAAKTPEEIEQYVLIASDASNPQQQEANAFLARWVSSTSDHLKAETLFPVLRQSQHELVLFFALTTFLQLRETTLELRTNLRQLLLYMVTSNSTPPMNNASTSIASAWNATYLRTKVGVLLASLIQQDFCTSPSSNATTTGWPHAFEDLQNPELLQRAPDILLRTLVALMDDFGHNETSTNAQIKDLLRGFCISSVSSSMTTSSSSTSGTSASSSILTTSAPATTTSSSTSSSSSLTTCTASPSQRYEIVANGATTPIIPPAQSISAQLLETIVTLLAQSLEEDHHDHNSMSQHQFSICVLALTALRGFMSWIDLSLILEEPKQTVLQLIFVALAKASKQDSPLADAGVVAVECMEELIARGMDQDKKLAILAHTHVLETIHSHVNLEQVDASPIDIVLEVAKFINRAGLEVLSSLFPQSSEQQQQQQQDQELTRTVNGAMVFQEHAKVRSQLLELFFRCFAFDDIDVSSAVIPLAGLLIPTQDKLQQQQSLGADPVLSQLLSVTYRQMRYPDDFQYDYEDEDEAEEEIYRTELRKLNQKLTRAAPDVCLQFICQALAQLPLPLSSASTSHMEAALRLVYHYCEGIRPPPGMKVVMGNETFCNVLIALHKSDISHHPHREVLTLYYETAIRYYPLLKRQPELLQTVLESLSGNRGLQHEHAKVRARCCYLLLRLVKSMGSSNSSNSNGSNILRPYVETAVTGIQALLENKTVQLRTEDTLNLFETIGLLLGKTGLEPLEQQRYLTQVMTPHVRSIQHVLEHQKDAIRDDPNTFGDLLADSIAAIAFLSKGFKKPAEPVQMVFLETLQISSTVLETLPSVESIRNKSMVLIQRLILCLEEKVLSAIPGILYLLVTHCCGEDILDVAQLFNQLCIRFKDKAVTAMEASLVPFLRKCHAIANNAVVAVPSPPSLTSPHTNGNGTMQLVAPHARTEQLSIQKLTYMVLNHVAMHGATGVLLTPTVLPSLEMILQSMCEGATRVEDPSMKKACLIFFKDVLEQWVVGVNGQNGSSSTVTCAVAPPASVLQGYVQFVCSNLVPGVLQSFGQKSFNLEDANQWRVVLEFAAMLDILHQHLPEVYYQEVLIGTMTNRLGCPGKLVENFQIAKDRKAMEGSLKTLIEHRSAK